MKSLLLTALVTLSLKTLAINEVILLPEMTYQTREGILLTCKSEFYRCSVSKNSVNDNWDLKYDGQVISSFKDFESAKIAERRLFSKGYCE